MTSAICSPDNGLTLNMHGFNLRIYSNKNMANGKHEYAINLSPNVEFSDKLIKEDNIHILFDVDNSCSMSAPILVNQQHFSRLTLCKKAINKSIEFLHVLAQKGKTVFITVVEFNSNSKTLLECYNLTKDKESFDLVYGLINNIKPTGATNLSKSIELVQSILDKHESVSKNVYKILLSDGYSNEGDDALYMKDKYKNYFNVCIGIGNETEYDRDLLKSLTDEDHERSCNSSEEINDQIIDSVFDNINIIASSINLGKNRRVLSTINSKRETINLETILNDIKITSSIFAILGNGSSFKLTINNVPDNYLYAGGLPKFNDSDQYFAINHIHFGSVDIFYTRGDEHENGIYPVKIEIIISCNNNNYNPSSNKRKTMFRIMQNFISVSNEIIKFNENNIINQKKHLTSIVSRLTMLSEHLNYQDNSETKTYIEQVIYKFTKIFKPMLKRLEDNVPLNLNLLTPVRMISSQASSGNYAFLGRQVSMGYSIANNTFNSVDISDSEISDNEALDNDNSDINIVNQNIQTPLYPGANAYAVGNSNAQHLTFPPPPLPISINPFSTQSISSIANYHSPTSQNQT
jgi:hypothetical protein